MTDVFFMGGKTYLLTRSENSQSTPANYGTYNSGGSDDKILQITSFTPTMKNNMIKVFTLGGGRSYKTVVPGKFEYSASFDFNMQNGNFMKYALGTVSSGTQATKTFDGATITGTPTAALKSYGCKESDVLDSFSTDLWNLSDASASDIKTQTLGCKVNQLSLKSDTENPLKATADILGQKPTTSVDTYTAPTTANYTNVPIMFYTGQLLIGSGDRGDSGTGTLNTLTDSTKAWTVNAWQTNYVLIDVNGTAFVISSNTATALTVSGTPATGEYVITPLTTLASAQVIQCNSVDSTIAQNLEQYWAIANTTGRGPRFIYEKMREYSLTLDLNFTNSEQLGRFYTGATGGLTPITGSTYSPFMVVVDHTTAVSDGDNYRAIRFVYSDVVIDELSLPVDPKDILKQTIRAFAKHLNVYYITAEVQ